MAPWDAHQGGGSGIIYITSAAQAALADNPQAYQICLGMAYRLGPGTIVRAEATGQVIIENAAGDHQGRMSHDGRRLVEYRLHEHVRHFWLWLPV